MTKIKKPRIGFVLWITFLVSLFGWLFINGNFQNKIDANEKKYIGPNHQKYNLALSKHLKKYQELSEKRVKEDDQLNSELMEILKIEDKK